MLNYNYTSLWRYTQVFLLTFPGEFNFCLWWGPMASWKRTKLISAAEIRKLDTEVVIIFITNMAQYAIRGYAVDAMDYVLKPVSYFAFSQRLDRAIGRIKKRETHYIVVPTRGGVQKLDVSRLYYVESRGHMCVGGGGRVVCPRLCVQHRHYDTQRRHLHDHLLLRQQDHLPRGRGEKRIKWRS